MKLSTICHWWIVLLILGIQTTQAQTSTPREDKIPIEDFTSCQTDCVQKWMLAGNTYFNQQAYKRAIPYFEQVLRLNRKESSPETLVPCLIDLSVTVAFDHQFERAYAHLDEASWLLRQQPSGLFQLKSYSLITKIRQTVDSLQSVHQQASVIGLQKKNFSFHAYQWTLLQVWKWGLPVGGIFLFALFWMTVYTAGKKEKIAWQEAASWKQLSSHLQLCSQQTEIEKSELIQQNKRLAATLQDSLGNLISATKLHVEQLESDWGERDEASARELHKVSQWLEQACKDLRLISQQLQSPSDTQNPTSGIFEDWSP